MDAGNLQAWVSLFGSGGVPVVLGWLAFTASKLFTRWSLHLDKQESAWTADAVQHSKATRHMAEEEGFLRRIADASDRSALPSSLR